MNNMKTALRMIAVMTLVTGIAYPLLVTACAQLFLSDKAGGSLITRDGKIVGSELIGQKFTSDKYFWSRPSAIEYNPMPSSGTNLGPTNKALLDAVIVRRDALLAGASANLEPPADLLFASASGLDPHISPKAAAFQVGRISVARQLDVAKQNTLLSLIEKCTEQPTFGLFGEPRVNVLKLNLAVDLVFPPEDNDR